MPCILPPRSKIDYAPLLARDNTLLVDGDMPTLLPQWSDDWLESYRAQCGRPIDVVEIPLGTFSFLFDLQGSDHGDGAEPKGMIPRVVVAYGTSAPVHRSRAKEDNRLRGWMGPTGRSLGNGWDKGHFVAHTMGGRIDGAEVNVFQQKRDLNRGWSAQGKVYRAMEKYCSKHPETGFFHRPIYVAETDIPDFLEFGIFKSDGTLCVDCFDNRLS